MYQRIHCTLKVCAPVREIHTLVNTSSILIMLNKQRKNLMMFLTFLVMFMMKKRNKIIASFWMTFHWHLIVEGGDQFKHGMLYWHVTEQSYPCDVISILWSEVTSIIRCIGCNNSTFWKSLHLGQQQTYHQPCTAKQKNSFSKMILECRELNRVARVTVWNATTIPHPIYVSIKTANNEILMSHPVMRS